MSPTDPPYADAVGHVRGVWVRAHQGHVALGTSLYSREEAIELARLLLLAAAEQATEKR